MLIGLLAASGPQGPQLTGTHWQVQAASQCLLLTDLTILQAFSCQTASCIIQRKITSTFTRLTLTRRDIEQVTIHLRIRLLFMVFYLCSPYSLFYPLSPR